MLSTFLLDNNLLNDLEVSWSPDYHEDSFNHSFLEHAFNLTSYTFRGQTVSQAHMQSLFTFIATHKSLKSLSLRFNDWREETEDSFIVFYENLVNALRLNRSIERITLACDILVQDFSAFASLFSEKTRPLLGRGLTFNNIPVDNIVFDLAKGLEDGLHWNSKANQKVFKLWFPNASKLYYG